MRAASSRVTNSGSTSTTTGVAVVIRRHPANGPLRGSLVAITDVVLPFPFSRSFSDAALRGSGDVRTQGGERSSNRPDAPGVYTIGVADYSCGAATPMTVSRLSLARRATTLLVLRTDGEVCR